MEHLEKPSEDGSEVIFTQPGDGDGATGPFGLVLDRRKMDGWMTQSRTMGPVLGRRKLTGRSMMC